MTVLSFLQIIAGIILVYGWLPQLKRAWTTRSTKDLSLQSFVITTFAISLMETYAIGLVVTGSGLPFLITNSACLLVDVVLVGSIVWIRKGE